MVPLAASASIRSSTWLRLAGSSPSLISSRIRTRTCGAIAAAKSSCRFIPWL